MHELASWNRLHEHIIWILPHIKFKDFKPLLKMNELVYDVIVLNPLMIDLNLG